MMQKKSMKNFQGYKIWEKAVTYHRAWPITPLVGICLMDWLHWHLLDQIATEPDQSLLIFSPFCSLVSLLMPAQCLLVCTRILKETWRNTCLDWKKTEGRGNAGQKLVVQKSSFKFPSSNWHDTRSMPAIFFCSFQSGAVKQVSSRRVQASV